MLSIMHIFGSSEAMDRSIPMVTSLKSTRGGERGLCQHTYRGVPTAEFIAVSLRRMDYPILVPSRC